MIARVWAFIGQLTHTIQIAAAVQTGSVPDANGNKSGWAAVGFSETGGMRGADVVYFTSSSTDIKDAYIRDELVQPALDSSQDWELIGYDITDYGNLIFEASRALDTATANGFDLLLGNRYKISCFEIVTCQGRVIEKEYEYMCQQYRKL